MSDLSVLLKWLITWCIRVLACEEIIMADFDWISILMLFVWTIKHVWYNVVDIIRRFHFVAIMKGIYNKTLWTIGHSNLDFDIFLQELNSFSIKTLVDVRSYPWSRKYPVYNKSSLEQSLELSGIRYVPIPDLGGRRCARRDSVNTAWKNKSFRAYADYMDENGFLKGIEELVSLAEKERTCIMCAEAVWWKCHRSMISDFMKSIGWTVVHIMGVNKSVIHPYTSVAKVNDGKLFYGSE